MPAKAQVPRLRRKLQKSVTRQRSNGPTRRPGSEDASNNEASSDNKSDTANKRAIAAPQPCLPSLTPDLSDSKWSEYLLRETGCFSSSTATPPDSSLPQRTSSPEAPIKIIPELSHLAINDAKPRQDTPAVSSTPRKMIRRRAKTPIFSIYQLEDIPRPGNALASPEKRLSAEVIAEQYRALLESRNSMLNDTHSEPPPSRHGPDGLLLEEEDENARRPRHSSEGTATAAIPAQIIPNHQPPEIPSGSPTTSDDGTLVAFEEETVYFKPVSFSPEPMSPHLEQRFRSQSPVPGNLSLQICLDLLTRDLASGLKSAQPNRSLPETTSALQVWVMIEAYERLRDQLVGMGIQEELRPLEMMFDMWLRALYTIHDALISDGRTSESDYGAEDLGMEELD
ncbi:hypothetical protein B0H66DRAFT_534515 [Apodospora peruviana]|uniref:Mating-type switching protein swi10 n=1 Tax=Apodospora peruviana TaxID=516989 RepID=A0AAE0I0P0_9PEZI|nr:hypothetical protein B0H66DRAFT_534515 [Apodospora peruviana]